MTSPMPTTPDQEAFKAEILKQLKEDYDCDPKMAEAAVKNASEFIGECYFDDDLDTTDVAESVYDTQEYWEGDER